jgi:hypothetical protein
MASSVKVLKAHPDAVAGISVGTICSRMNGNKDNFIMTDEKGVTISGPISIVQDTNQIRIGAIYTMNNAVDLQVPSSLVTPVPVLIANVAVEQYTSIMKDSMAMMALFGALV